MSIMDQDKLLAPKNSVAQYGFETLADTVAQGDPEDWRAWWRQAAGVGVLSDLMPINQGGAERSASEFVRMMIDFGASVADNGLSMGLNSHVWTVQQPIVAFGSPDQKALLPNLMSGDTIGAFALTEANAGSDALNMETRAEKRDGGYVLNGAKALIGMGPVCDVAIVFAKTAPEHGRWGISAFIVKATDAGFYRDDPVQKMGLTTLPLGPMRFEECWIPEDRRLGAEGAGASIIQATLNWERCFILAPHVGAMRRQLNACIDYTHSRNVFGQEVSAFQSVSNRLADMRVRLETCELMLMRAAQMYDAGEPLTQYAAMTNLHISEAFLSSSLDALRNFGGVGYLERSQIGEDVRDSAGGVIYSGTSDVQRQIIAKMEHQIRMSK